MTATTLERPSAAEVTTQPPDPAHVEAFAGQVVGIINSAALALMLSVGHRTGLFDTLAALPPATSDQIAATTGLQERYVREWLAALVTGGIVDDQPSTGTYAHIASQG
jgi:hypothetical protein